MEYKICQDLFGAIERISTNQVTVSRFQERPPSLPKGWGRLFINLTPGCIPLSLIRRGGVLKGIGGIAPKYDSRVGRWEERGCLTTSGVS